MKIAFGTDQGLVPHGENAKEFALMVDAGMTPMRRDPGRHPQRRRPDRRQPPTSARCQPGRFADIIAVTGDPLADVRQLEHVGFVMKGGTVYRKDGEDTGAGGAKSSGAH